MPTVDGVKADHHKYIIPGQVDADVVAEQSRRQADKLGESSYVHDHRAGEKCIGYSHQGYGPIQVVQG